MCLAWLFHYFSFRLCWVLFPLSFLKLINTDLFCIDLMGGVLSIPKRRAGVQSGLDALSLEDNDHLGGEWKRAMELEKPEEGQVRGVEER